MSDASEQSPIVQFIGVWTESFTHVLGQLGVATPSVAATEPAPAKALSADELAVTYSCFFKGGGVLKGDQVWVGEKAAALQCAQLLMSEPLDPAAEFSDTHKDAFAELFRQVAGQAATSWKQVAGDETEIAFQAATEGVFVPAQSCTVSVSGEKFPKIDLRFFVNSALFDSLAIKSPAEPEASAATGSSQAPALDNSDTEHASQSLSELVPHNLELLLEVELDASIRFGERDMLLRDVFGLMPGAVVELNQLVNEPAALLVAGRTIARGEVVVVDGNFGLRVTEVISRSQRAELLKL